MNSSHPRKVLVVGAGAMGSTFCYALAQSGLADEIMLIDRNETLACERCDDWKAKRDEIEQQARDSAYHIILNPQPDTKLLLTAEGGTSFEQRLGRSVAP